MKSLILILAISTCSMLSTNAKIKFKDCNMKQAIELREYSVEAIDASEKLLREINSSLSYDLPRKIKRKVKRARNVVECVIKKLPKAKYVCSEKLKGNVVAQTMPVIGKKITLFPLFWKSSDRYKVSTLVHEATHKCATTDANYNYQRGSKPESEGIIGWQNIASTYDYWIQYGFCIPGEDC